MSRLDHCVSCQMSVWMERGSSAIENQIQSRKPGFEFPLLPFSKIGCFLLSPQRLSSLSCIDEYLAIDSSGNVSK